MQNNINWTIQLFDELTTSTLYEILHLRSKIFVVEQADIYLDADNQDQQALHIIGKKGDEIVAYCRTFASNAQQAQGKIGRVLVVSAHRGLGIGQLLIEQALLALKNEPTIKIAAQLYLQTFYEGFGFQISGKPYLDGSVEHIDMYRERS